MGAATNAARATQGGSPGHKPQSFLFALKDGDTFVVCNSFGDIEGDGDGLFCNDTRVLSHFKLRIADAKPDLLSTARSKDNVFLTSHAVNAPLAPLGGHHTPGGIVHIERVKLLWDGYLHERIACVNYGDGEAVLPITLSFGADFADMFEVRGTKRQYRGQLHPPEIGESAVTLRYEGLDRLWRTTTISFSEIPSRLTGSEAVFLLQLPPGATQELYIEIGPSDKGKPDLCRFRNAAARARWSMRKRLKRGARLKTSGRLFNEWIDRSRADLALLTTELATGPFPYAGIPWFSTPFGRDAIITALQTLWLDPALARGVLAYLAQTQATENSSFKDSAPGKIMHETRKGEMTALGELPFGQYYGGIDTTPLFIMLAGAYAERTGDMSAIVPLWPALIAALKWIENALDTNSLGFLAYNRAEKTGLANQGWKDSEDSIFHADGRMAQGPVALVEVQGYAFAAFRTMAELADRQADAAAAVRWRARAESLRRRVESCFWLEKEKYYGIAIDGSGKLCRVRASNAGHLLFAGLPEPERVRNVANHLLSAAFNSGWGVRTLAAGEVHFNPMSYHNGSVWPHDTALCTAGMARYGERKSVVRLLSEMFEAAVNFDMQLPELICGFPRAPGEPPIAYPVACMPQAWAAGAPFMMLQACLGIRLDGWNGEIHIERPYLPAGIDSLSLKRLEIRGHEIDLNFERLGNHVVVTPAQSESSPIRVIIHA
ncbi:MAG TPA: amylo-alpha-1,6-glucosidase [Rhizomicrobium sp.]|nr:amylo-alpha-1,6-glucosidase [Rhizomicrobium sp.]